MLEFIIFVIFVYVVIKVGVWLFETWLNGMKAIILLSVVAVNGILKVGLVFLYIPLATFDLFVAVFKRVTGRTNKLFEDDGGYRDIAQRMWDSKFFTELLDEYSKRALDKLEG